MRYVLLLPLMLVGCASSSVSTSLPLHPERIVVPRSVDRDAYVSAYCAEWLAHLKIYAADIDHRHDRSEDIAIGTFSVEGWIDGRNAIDDYVRSSIAAEGREATAIKLQAAMKGLEESARSE